jgi:hypothetical protein
VVAFVFEDAAFEAGGARGFAAAFEFFFCDGFFFGAVFVEAQGFGKAVAGKDAVARLGTGVLNGDGDAGGDVAQGDFSGDFVDVLPARAGGTVEVFGEVGVPEWLCGFGLHTPEVCRCIVGVRTRGGKAGFAGSASLSRNEVRRVDALGIKNARAKVRNYGRF